MASVVDQNEILLNSVRYPISSPPRKVLTSLFAPKITVGDTSPQAQQHVSTIAWDDFRGGIGIERGIDSSTIDRCWFSDLTLRFKDHLILGPLTKSVSAPSGTDNITSIHDYNNQLFVTFGSALYELQAGLSYGSIDTLAGSVTDVATFRISGTLWIIWACNADGYSYSSNGTSRTNSTAFTPKYLAVWNDRLYGINEAGLLKYSSNGTSWTSDAQLNLPDNSVTDLFVGRDTSGNPILYANTKRGLYVHDNTNTKWLESEVSFPFHPLGGQGTVKWRDAIYFPVGLGIYRYKVADTSTLTVVGPDQDHGLPIDVRGNIRKLVGTHNDLVALCDGTSGTEGLLFPMGANGSKGGFAGSEVIENSGNSSVLAFNELGYQVLWKGTSSQDVATEAFVSTALQSSANDPEYRLWFSAGNTLYYQDLSKDIINPDQTTSFNFAASGLIELPNFDADDITSDKLAIKMKVETQGCSSTETITPYYSIDDATASDGTISYTQFTDTDGDAVSITSNGVTELTFYDSSNNATGKTFKSIRFKMAYARGSTTTVSPAITRMEFSFRRKLTPKFGWQVGVNLMMPKGRKTYKGKTSKQMQDNLTTAINSNELVEFTYKDNDSSRTYYVDVAQVSGLELTGTDERFSKQITLLQV
jgi:hypothetical protein